MRFPITKRVLSDIGAGLGRLVYFGFRKYTANAIATQEKLLVELVRKNKNTEYGKKYDFCDINSVEKYQNSVPLTTYRDYAPYVERMLSGEKNLITSSAVHRYVETSGSVGKPKIVPQVSRAMFNFQCMGFVAPVACAYEYFKEKGIHLPPQKGLLALEATSHILPNGKKCSCLSSAPLIYLKPFATMFTTSPKDVLFPEHAEQMDMQYLKLRFALPERDVSYLGAMVVTVSQTLFKYLEDNWCLLTDDIEKGIISDSVRMPEQVRRRLTKKLRPDPQRASELRSEFEKGFDVSPIVPRIWPKLGWMYAMMSGNLTVYDHKLRRYTGDLPLHNMGYGASEALMAMPLKLNEPDCVMLPKSAFYEFLPVDAPEGTRPLMLGEVKQGGEYEVILTNISGFYRYRMEDVVRVTGFYGQSPKIEFLYRANLVMNICAEKMTQQMLDDAVENTAAELGLVLTAYSAYADNESDPARYMLFLETVNDGDAQAVAKRIDSRLCDVNLDYAKFRNTNAIGAPAVRFLESGTYNEYLQHLRETGVNINQVKPVCVINTPEKKEFFFARVRG